MNLPANVRDAGGTVDNGYCNIYMVSAVSDWFIRDYYHQHTFGEILIMKPITKTEGAESANIISIETLKRAAQPEKPVTSAIADLFMGVERLSQNPVMAPLFTAGAQALQAYAANMMQKVQNQQNTSENDVKVLFE